MYAGSGNNRAYHVMSGGIDSILEGYSQIAPVGSRKFYQSPAAQGHYSIPDGTRIIHYEIYLQTLSPM